MAGQEGDLKWIRVIRGPVIVSCWITTIILPMLLQLSRNHALGLAILTTGIALTCWDWKHILESELRALKRKLEMACHQLVLDDVLVGMFDMQEGLMGACLGTLGLYSGVLEREERLDVVEWFYTEARKVLTSPGGFLELLPCSWLQYVRDEGKGVSFVVMQGETTMQDLSWPDHNDETTELSASASDSTLSYNHHAIEQPLPTSNPSTTLQDQPNIFIQIAVRRLNLLLTSLDSKLLRLLSCSTLFALVIHLRSSATARRILSFLLHTALISTSLSIFTASQFALVSKSVLMGCPTTLYHPTQSLSPNRSSIFTSILLPKYNSYKLPSLQLLQNIRSNKLRSALSLFLIVYFSQRSSFRKYLKFH